MTWKPIAFLPPQYENTSGVPYSGAVLKAYQPETTTPIAFATDNTGATMASSLPLNAAGYPNYLGTVVIPYVNQDYKLALYPTQAAADADNGAVWTVDNIQISDDTNLPFFESFDGNGSTSSFTLTQNMGNDPTILMVFADRQMQDYSVNGTFTTDTIWTKGAGWAIGAGVATATGAISTALSENAGIPVVAGQSYTVQYTTVVSAGTVTASVGGVAGTARSSSGTYTETIIAGATQVIALTGASFTGTIDNVSVKSTAPQVREILRPDELTLVGNLLTLNYAPPTGTKNILVFAPSLLLGAANNAAAAAATSAATSSNSATASAASAATATTQASNAATSATASAASAATAGTQASNAATSATTAGTQASNAATSATAAAASAVLAASIVTATSTSSNTIGTGNFTFTTQAGKNFFPGQIVIAASNASGANYIHGFVQSYSGTTLVITETDLGGSGSHSDWNISLSGPVGASGTGSGTVTTVAIATANGFAGTVANPTSTPAITLKATSTGILKSDGTTMSAASAGTDYLAPNGSGAALTSLTAANIAAGTAGISVTGNAATVTTNANLTGDVGSVGNATTLATVNSNVGSFSAANITVNAKGLVTAAANGTSLITPLGVGCILVCQNNSGSNISTNSNTAASNLEPKQWSVTGNTASSVDVISGTWKAQQNVVSGACGLWQRVA